MMFAMGYIDLKPRLMSFDSVIMISRTATDAFNEEEEGILY